MRRLIALFIAFLFIFALVGCGETENTSSEDFSMPEGVPEDFAIRFVSKYIHEEIYDTYTGVIQKDLVVDGTAKTEFTPKPETIAEIYSKVLEYKICEITRKVSNSTFADPNGEQFAVTPLYEYEIEITINGKDYKITGDGTAMGYTDSHTEAYNFMKFVGFMQKTLNETEEYKNLPEPNGGYD